MEIGGKTAIVTGTSSGIGRAVAAELARQGATVFGMARRADKVEESAEECRAHTPASRGVVGDVSSRRDCERVVASAVEASGAVDIVVNNAGVSLRRHASRTTIDEIERVMQINFMGAVYLAMTALPSMLERRSGAIVNVTSVAGTLPTPRESAYGASKAALALWTHGLAVDLHGSGVAASVVSPGPIATEIWEKDAEDATYSGKLYPPQVVADGVVKAITHGVVQMTVPRHYGLPGVLYSLVPRPMRWGLRKFEGQA